MSDNFVQEEIESAVEMGIDYLRNAYGGVTGLDWLSKVDVSRLNMADNRACVLGQITGDFATSPLVITFGFQQASQWGFYLTADDLDKGLGYDALTAEWKRRLEALKLKRADILLQLENAGVTDSWYEEV